MPSKIEWTNETLNPITGCSPISEGCEHCYAARMAKRLAGRMGYDKENPFQLTFHEDKLYMPARWKKPRRIFIGSMTDLFHEDVPDAWLDCVMEMVEKHRHHTFMILTKRPHRMRDYIERYLTKAAHRYHMWRSEIGPLRNLWLGVTAENQQRAEERIPILLTTPASKRFVSCEPLLGPICFDQMFWKNPLDWIIVGAETGPGKRRMKLDWARNIRTHCASHKVPFFFKKDSYGDSTLAGVEHHEFPAAGGE